MKKIVIFLLILTITLNFIVPIAAATTDANADISSTSCHGIDANSTLLGSDKITDNVRAAFLYEANSQTVMYTLNPDQPMFPASLVKIMSALLAIELGNLDDVVTVSDSAVSSVPFDAVSIKLQVGERVKLLDLLYSMVVGSANDAAAVVAEHISGSQEEFVAQMNQYAEKIGCTGTNFVNVHGLHHDEQVTTARDVTRILDKALQNETFREIFVSKQHIIDATNMSEYRKITTNNDLLDSTSTLYFDDRVIGGRSGVTEDGRRCMAAASESNGMLLLSVVMGTESVYQEDGYSAISVGGYKETTALLDAGFSGHKAAQILYAHQPLEQCNVDGGNCDLIIGPIDAVSSVLPTDTTADDLTYRYTISGLSAPISKGQKITSLQIWNGNLCVGETELFALNTVNTINQADDAMRHDSGNGTKTIVFVLLGIIIGVCIVLILIKYIPAFLAKKRRAQYRRSHRRSR